MPRELRIPTGTERAVGETPCTWYDAGTNGLVYARILTPLGALDESQLADLPLYCDMVTELGAADRDYRTNQAYQAAVVGGLDASVSLRGTVSDANATDGYFVLAGKALARNQLHLTGLLNATGEPADSRERTFGS